MRIRVLAVVVVGALAVAVAGCSLVPSVEPTPSPTQVETPEPTAIDPVAPDPVLPATCGELLPAASIDAQLGFAPSEPGNLSGYGLAANRQAGWAWCSWISDSPSVSLSITFDLRHDGTTATATATATEPECHSATADYANCAMTRVVGAWLIRGQLVTGPGVTPSDPVASLAALLQPVFDRLAAATAPVLWTRPDDAGPAILDCSAVSAELDRAALGLPDGATLVDVTNLGEDGSIPREEAAVGGETVCKLTNDQAGSGPAGIELSFLSGGGWAWDDLIAGPGSAAEPVSIAGAEDAAFECSPAGGCLLVVRLGADLARIVGTQGPEGTPMTRDQIRGVGGELVPALLAALA